MRFLARNSLSVSTELVSAAISTSSGSLRLQICRPRIGRDLSSHSAVVGILLGGGSAIDASIIPSRLCASPIAHG
jgi:hypothetical protein